MPAFPRGASSLCQGKRHEKRTRNENKRAGDVSVGTVAHGVLPGRRRSMAVRTDEPRFRERSRRLAVADGALARLGRRGARRFKGHRLGKCRFQTLSVAAADAFARSRRHLPFRCVGQGGFAQVGRFRKADAAGLVGLRQCGGQVDRRGLCAASYQAGCRRVGAL